MFHILYHRLHVVGGLQAFIVFSCLLVTIIIELVTTEDILITKISGDTQLIRIT